MNELTDEFLLKDAVVDRLLLEYKHYEYLYIGYDFDNTVSAWGDPNARYDAVINLIKELGKTIHCKMVCWTANPNVDYVEKYLIENEIPFDGINCDGLVVNYECRKPIFSVLFDDRAGLLQTYNDLTKFLEIVKSNPDIYKLKNAS